VTASEQDDELSIDDARAAAAEGSKPRRSFNLPLGRGLKVSVSKSITVVAQPASRRYLRNTPDRDRNLPPMAAVRNLLPVNCPHYPRLNGSGLACSTPLHVLAAV
jgi:hypothetical protein